MKELFFDPVFVASTWGCIFMSIACSLAGVFALLQKRSLIPEVLSHASYPGACLFLSLWALFLPEWEDYAFFAVILGAFVSSFFGFRSVLSLTKKKGISSDAALCFILSIFFGIGLVIASAMQRKMPSWYQRGKALLFGQPVTMGELHVAIYFFLALAFACFILFSFRRIQAFLFDSTFCTLTGLGIKGVERGIFWLFLLAIVVSIRCVGVVLVSGMLIAPGIAASMFSQRLKGMFLLAPIFGVLSVILGSYVSLKTFSPMGPSIVFIAGLIALFSLLLSPKKGLLSRWVRIGVFRLRCIEENALKAMWLKRAHPHRDGVWKSLAFWRLKRGGWIDAEGRLTKEGKNRGAWIVRLHRLWELYLTEELGFHAGKVHRTAEEMEHILTLEMEQRLTKLLENPLKDPHEQPIPEKEI